MNWFTEGAEIIIALFTLNFAVFLTRAKFQLKDARQAVPTFRREMTSFEISVYLLMVLSWLVGVALPYISPGSTLGRALTQPWAVPSLVAWSMLFAFVAVSAQAVAKLLLRRRAKDADLPS